MEIKYYGTSAGAGIPEIFCSCRVCTHARENRGKNIRTRSQAVIDGKLSLDFSVDTFMHTIYGGLDMTKINHILITHAHHDHFLKEDVISRYQGLKDPLYFYCSAQSGAELKKVADAREQLFLSGKKQRTDDCRVEVIELDYFKPIKILDYTVTPLRARHAAPLGAMIYIIQSENKNILWAHDTGLLPPDTEEYIKASGIVFDFVSLDCTLKRGAPITESHMDLDRCVETVKTLRENGNIKDDTKIVLSHIGHLVEKTHEEFQKEADEFNFMVAYDGMSVII